MSSSYVWAVLVEPQSLTSPRQEAHLSQVGFKAMTSQCGWFASLLYEVADIGATEW